MTYSGGFARLLGLSPGEAMSELVPGGDGREAYLRGTVLDVTDTRVAERERLEAVTLFQQGFDAAPIGMVLTDPLQGRYVRVNDAMCRLLDRSRESLIGVGMDAVTHPDDRGADQRSRRAMLGGRPDRLGDRAALPATEWRGGLGDAPHDAGPRGRWLGAGVLLPGGRHHRAQAARGTV